MAGLSLQCGDCGAALRTVEEAQQHGEITGHANFVESTQPVLNLVCNVCGKPCRSQTEVDLHSKRTGHVDFVDKTAEAAKPIDLESKAEVMDIDSKEEMVAPEVSKELLEELEAMGFPRARATRSLYYSKAENLEGAVNWIVEHESDPDIDKELLVPKSSLKPSLTPEQAKAKAQELVERARKKKEEEEKKMEREREKERIRAGKELLEAKRKEEESERKRILMYRKAQKEEENRAREKILQRIEEDRAERRRKLGLPAEEAKPAEAPAPAQAPAPASDPKTNFQQPKPASKSEELRSCLRTIKQEHKSDDAQVKKAFQTLQTYIGNIGRAPREEKFRKIRVTNPTFQERVAEVGGVKFLELCGFELDESGEFLNLSQERTDILVLRAADKELSSAISNPFFGVL